MCGIDVVITYSCDKVNQRDNGGCSRFISRRGPDDQNVVSFDIRASDGTRTDNRTSVKVAASVLHMRGSHVVKQPCILPKVDIHGEQGRLLCWNGEIYQHAGTDQVIHEMTNSGGTTASDTLWLANHPLWKKTSTTTLESLLSILSTLVNAEYAVAVVDHNCVYYARDPWGRRSLLLASDSLSPSWHLASLATDTTLNWQEIVPGVIHQYIISTRQTKTHKLNMNGIMLTANGAQTLLSEVALLPCPDKVARAMWKASFVLEDLLRAAVRRRLVRPTPDQVPLAVLFSGGLDSAVLAALAAEQLPRTKLLLWNVAFRASSSATSSPDQEHPSKDRQAALQTYRELASHHNNLQLQCIDPTWDDIQTFESHIKQLIFPKTTVMDLNIGMALWFAARGTVEKASTPTTFSPRILLVGMGADEQLGGYGRHRKAAAEHRLQEELRLDMDRLWERNLGRDDRIVGDHGREARFPFLDANVVQFLTYLRATDANGYLCDFTLPPGEGDKRILRLVAHRLGIPTAAGLVKRAIQFGSRVSQVSDKHRFGSRRQTKGQFNLAQGRGTTTQ